MPRKVAPAFFAPSTIGSDLVGLVVDAGHQRRDQDAGVDAAAAELGDGIEARRGPRRVRLGRPPGVLVEGRHREVDPDRKTSRAMRSKISTSRITSGDLVSTETGVSAASSAARISGIIR